MLEALHPMIDMLPIQLAIILSTAHAIHAVVYCFLGWLMWYTTHKHQPKLRLFFAVYAHFIFWCGVGHAICALPTMFWGGIWWWLEGIVLSISAAISAAAVWTVWDHRQEIASILRANKEGSPE